MIDWHPLVFSMYHMGAHVLSISSAAISTLNISMTMNCSGSFRWSGCDCAIRSLPSTNNECDHACLFPGSGLSTAGVHHHRCQLSGHGCRRVCACPIALHVKLAHAHRGWRLAISPLCCDGPD